jgi:RNA ligase (TIGR02306 family)
MATWRVVADHIHLMPHPKADRLLIGNIGGFQIIVPFDKHVEGEVVVFAPERSLLPNDLKTTYVSADTGESYLEGENANRVHVKKLRGENSEGVILPTSWVAERLGVTPENIPLDTNLAPALGITKYAPPLSPEMDGRTFCYDTSAPQRRHDVESLRLYAEKFVGKRVTVTEKLNGTQVSAKRDAIGQEFVTSKMFNAADRAIAEDAKNIYWRGVKNSEIFKRIKSDSTLDGKHVEIFGEVFPARGGYRYGLDVPRVGIFRIILDGIDLVRSQMEAVTSLADLLVPKLFEGEFDEATIIALSKGNETLSGKGVHIKEGVVVTFADPTNSNFPAPYLAVKVINPKHHSTADDIS